MSWDQQRAVCFHSLRPTPRVPLDLCFRAKGPWRHIVNLKSTFIMVHIRPKTHLNNSFISLYAQRRQHPKRCVSKLLYSPPIFHHGFTSQVDILLNFWVSSGACVHTRPLPTWPYRPDVWLETTDCVWCVRLSVGQCVYVCVATVDSISSSENTTSLPVQTHWVMDSEKKLNI